MKGIFGPYVLWPFDKKVDFLISNAIRASRLYGTRSPWLMWLHLQGVRWQFWLVFGWFLIWRAQLSWGSQAEPSWAQLSPTVPSLAKPCQAKLSWTKLSWVEPSWKSLSSSYGSSQLGWDSSLLNSSHSLIWFCFSILVFQFLSFNCIYLEIEIWTNFYVLTQWEIEDKEIRYLLNPWGDRNQNINSKMFGHHWLCSNYSNISE